MKADPGVASSPSSVGGCIADCSTPASLPTVRPRPARVQSRQEPASVGIDHLTLVLLHAVTTNAGCAGLQLHPIMYLLSVTNVLATKHHNLNEIFVIFREPQNVYVE